jgi:hypothetical protein
MRFFSSTLAVLALLTVALFGALVFLVSSGLSSDSENEAVLNGPLGIAESSSAVAVFPPVQEVDPGSPLPAVYEAAWFVAEGYAKVLAVADLRDFDDHKLLVLDESRRRVFQRESAGFVDAEAATLEALGRDGALLTTADEKLVLVGPVVKVNGEAMRRVIQLTEVDATS